jgi:hypothetical protein
MSPLSWMTMLPVCWPKAKQNQEPVCPQCHECRRIVRYGRYWRYRYGCTSERIAVARYACLNPACSRRTFSVLPHGLLPQVRMPLCLLMALYQWHMAQPLNFLARMLRHSWTTIRRAVTLARSLLDWCRREVTAEALDPWPCHPDRWPAFCRAFSYAFRPARFAPQPINTIR